jgi:hypothetical protein
VGNSQRGLFNISSVAVGICYLPNFKVAMTELVATIAIVLLAAVMVVRYVWLEINNPCRGCKKECDKRRK